MSIDSAPRGRPTPWRSLSNASWAHHQFSHARLGDRRLVKRLQSLAVDAARAPGASIPRRAGAWAGAKAAYRFFANPKVSDAAILEAHRQVCHQRVQGQKTVLVAQDTTSLNYSERPGTQGLGPISNRAARPLGLLAHVSLVLTPEGCPLGVADAHFWARSAAAHGRNRERNRRPLAEKESQRWLDSLSATARLAQAHPQTRFINIADREGDIYELFALALQFPNVHALVRAQHDRCVEGAHGFLFATLRAQERAGFHTIQAARRPGQKARPVRLEIRWTQLTVRAPLLKEGQAPLRLWAIEAREVDAPPDKAILWRLVSACPVRNLEEAIQQVTWYARRWQVEVFFRTLKSGCKVEEKQLRQARALQALLALEMIVACRVMELARAGREDADRPASQALSPQECALVAALHKPAVAPEELTLRMAQRRIAQLGGFLGRKGDGDPGPMTLWAGLQRLRDMTLALELAQSCG